ncbi:hypothetical protein GCM10008944_01360 [Cytobacillus oceanisediminis]
MTTTIIITALFVVAGAVAWAGGYIAGSLRKRDEHDDCIEQTREDLVARLPIFNAVAIDDVLYPSPAPEPASDEVP